MKISSQATYTYTLTLNEDELRALRYTLSKVVDAAHLARSNNITALTIRRPTDDEIAYHDGFLNVVSAETLNRRP